MENFSLLRHLAEWPYGPIFIIIVVGLLVLLTMPIFRNIGHALDSWWRPLKTANGMIGKKQVQFQKAKSWKIWVLVGRKAGAIKVTERFFDSISKGQSVTVIYVTGRFTGDFYVRGVWIE